MNEACCADGGEEKKQGRSVILAGVLLWAVVFAIYFPAVNCEFVKYDDDKYVTDNRHVLEGLSWEGVRWAFTTGHASNWHPVTWLSHMLDCTLFGTRAWGHHLVNVLLHTANTVLLFLVLRRMTGSTWASWFVAAVFGLHPLHVESVAWVAERKDVLSTLFWILTMWAYAAYCERPRIWRYLSTVGLFALGLMAKPMLVTLPFVLLLLDYWPLYRLSAANPKSEARPGFANRLRRGENPKQIQITEIQNTKQVTGSKQKTAIGLLLEKIPFFILSAVSSVVTVMVQRAGGAVPTVEALGLRARAANAIVSYVGYITKMFWPTKLAALYPHPVSAIPAIAVASCGLALVVLTVVFLWLGRRHGYFAVGWLWYVGTLVPVIGLVQAGMQSMADRYTYVPMTGLVIIIAWWVRELVESRRRFRFAAAIAAGAVLVACAVCTRQQIRYWRDSASLFEHTLSVTSDNWLIHNNYANILKEKGRYEEAIEHFKEAIRIKPSSAEVYNNLAGALGKAGRAEEEIECYRKALALKGDFVVGHYNLAAALSRQGKRDEAVAEYRKALELQPDYADALSNLGFELAEKGEYEEALGYYKKAIEIEPGNIIAHGRMALALARLDRIDEAIRECRIVLRARPDDEEMYFNVGVLLERQGKNAEAIEAYRQAMKFNPADGRASERLKVLEGK